MKYTGKYIEVEVVPPDVAGSLGYWRIDARDAATGVFDTILVDGAGDCIDELNALLDIREDMFEASQTIQKAADNG